jgi:hypothetical protein
MSDNDYNGWKNYQTWSVANELNNDMYCLACDYAEWRKEQRRIISYNGFISWAGIDNDRTYDGVRFDDKRVSRTELNELLRELV